eukprot:5837342-Pyramimonas_sp.AAC.1
MLLQRRALKPTGSSVRVSAGVAVCLARLAPGPLRPRTKPARSSWRGLLGGTVKILKRAR